MSTTGNKRGRPRSQRDWNQNFKLSAQIGFSKHPAVHTFLYVNMENEHLSDIVAKALESYLEIHAPDYFDAEYQARVVQEARERETAKLMQAIRSEKVEIPRSVIQREIAEPTAAKVVEPKLQPENPTVSKTRGGLFPQVQEPNAGEESENAGEESEEDLALANKLIG